MIHFDEHTSSTQRIQMKHAPDGKVNSHIDYILAPQRYKSSINKLKHECFPKLVSAGASELKSNLKMKMKRKNKIMLTPLQTVGFQYCDGVSSQTLEHAVLKCLRQDLKNPVNTFNDPIRETANECIGNQRHKNQPWVPDESPPLHKRIRQLKITTMMNQLTETNRKRDKKEHQGESEGRKIRVDSS